MCLSDAMKHIVFLLLLIGALSAWTQIQGGTEQNAAAVVAPIVVSHESTSSNLDDCLNEIDRLWDDTRKESARGQSEQEFLLNQDSGLGEWVEEHWDLEGSNLLTKYFQGLGIVEAHDMASIILRGYHRHLRQSPVAVAELVQGYK